MAKPKELPSKMPREKALEFENLSLKIDAIKYRAEMQVHELQQKYEAIAAEFSLGPSDKLNPSTGEIVRAVKP